MMDLEQFLEKNILMFLDSKIQRSDIAKKDREEEYGLYLTKDYLKELNQALENDELSKAKKLFDELKDRYSKLSKNDPERKKLYEILEKMYEKIQQYVEIKEGKIEVITEGSSQILKERDYKTREVGLGRDVNQPIIINKKFETINRSSLPIKFYKDNTEKSIGGEGSGLGSGELEADLGIGGSKGLGGEGVGGIGDKSKKISDIDAGLNSGAFGAKNKNLEEPKIKPIPDRVEIRSADEFMDVQLRNITDKLLYDFKRKFEEDEYEEDKKIDDLRREIHSKVTEEVYKLFDTEKIQIADMIEKMRQEMLDQVYMKAKEIVTSSDISASQNSLNMDSEIEEPEFVPNKDTDSSSYDILTEEREENNSFDTENVEEVKTRKKLNPDIIVIPSQSS